MRARMVAAALRAYPRAYREEHGPELAATALDASAGSAPRLTRELLDLARLGLRMRATQTASAGAGRLVADTFCLAGTWFAVLDLSAQAARRASGDPDRVLAAPTVALIAATLVLALVGLDRLAGVAGLSYTLIGLAELMPDEHSNVLVWSSLLPLACFAVMAAAPRRRRRDLRRLAWLIVPGAIAATALSDGDPSVVTALGALVFLVLPAVAALPTDPRRAIACALIATEIGIVIAAQGETEPPALWFLAAAPVVLAVAVARTRRLQRRAAM
jgi:hypothetical protein